MKIKYLTIVATLLTACCSENSNGTIETPEELAEVLSKTEPCEVLTEQLVRSTYALDESIEVTKSESYGVCSYSWEIASEMASEDEQIDAILNAARTGKLGNTVATASKGYYSASFNFSTVSPKSTAEASNSFDTIIEQLEGGVKVDKTKIKEEMVKQGMDPAAADEYVKDEGITFSSGQMEAVAGVGEKAMWSIKRKQMTVLSGTSIFFVNADAGGDVAASKEMASKLAQTIITKL